MSTSPGATARSSTAARSSVLTRRMLNKVPEVTIFFWVIKVLCTTVGQSAADYVDGTLGFGTADTAKVSGAVLAVALLVQFRLDRYVPLAYWLVVVAVSVFGALMAELLTDVQGIAPGAVTALYAAGLGLVLAAWWAVERTLSLQTIVTVRREAFYWAAVVLAFALGSAAGDVVVENAGIGYAVSIGIFGAVLAVIAVAHRRGADAVLTFWLAFVVTGPLGAAVGDELARNTHRHSGLGLGTTGTSAIFAAVILALVAYLTVTHRDRPRTEATA
jgi:uncharacterized membrane-anchored protein